MWGIAFTTAKDEILLGPPKAGSNHKFLLSLTNKLSHKLELFYIPKVNFLGHGVDEDVFRIIAGDYRGHIVRHLAIEDFVKVVANVIDVQLTFIADSDHFVPVGSNGEIKHSIQAPLVDHCTSEIPDNDFFVNTGRDECLPVRKPAANRDNVIVFHCPDAEASLELTWKVR